VKLEIQARCAIRYKVKRKIILKLLNIYIKDENIKITSEKTTKETKSPKLN